MQYLSSAMSSGEDDIAFLSLWAHDEVHDGSCIPGRGHGLVQVVKKTRQHALFGTTVKHKLPDPPTFAHLSACPPPKPSNHSFSQAQVLTPRRRTVG